MLSLGYDKIYNIILGLAATVHIIFMLVLVPNYFAVGASISFVLTELIVAASTALFVYKYRILELKKVLK